MRTFIQRDRANDQVYLGFSQSALRRGGVKKTVTVTEDIALDFDARGRLVGIDVSNASAVVGPQALAETPFADELLGVAEAAKLLGVRKPNFLRDFATKPGFPEPVADLASGRIWWRSQVLAYAGARAKHSPGLADFERFLQDSKAEVDAIMESLREQEAEETRRSSSSRKGRYSAAAEAEGGRSLPRRRLT